MNAIEGGIAQEKQVLRGYYKEILQALGEPPEDGTPFPIPDCTSFVFSAHQSIHSPLFLLVDHKEIGLLPIAAHQYNAPGGIGEGKVIVQARRPVGDSWATEPIIVVEGIIANPLKGYTHSFSLRENGYQRADIHHSMWRGQELEVVSNPSRWYGHDQ